MAGSHAVVLLCEQVRALVYQARKEGASKAAIDSAIENSSHLGHEDYQFGEFQKRPHESFHIRIPR